MTDPHHTLPNSVKARVHQKLLITHTAVHSEHDCRSPHVQAWIITSDRVRVSTLLSEHVLLTLSLNPTLTYTKVNNKDAEALHPGWNFKKCKLVIKSDWMIALLNKDQNRLFFLTNWDVLRPKFCIGSSKKTNIQHFSGWPLWCFCSFWQ